MRSWTWSTHVLREGGTLVTIAYPPETPPQEHRLWVRPLIMRPRPEQFARIGELAAFGAVRVEIAHRFRLADVQRAHALSESGHTRGKIVLTVSTQAAGDVTQSVPRSSSSRTHLNEGAQ